MRLNGELSLPVTRQSPPVMTISDSSTRFSSSLRIVFSTNATAPGMSSCKFSVVLHIVLPLVLLLRWSSQLTRYGGDAEEGL